ncbi:MAG: hypothetical protein DHS20C21_05370 [Gemmatimonadota bacterium]|nr:MAG: hypothetical protein DHS20C21_05370 [Gemmatimonadota bacterium]
MKTGKGNTVPVVLLVLAAVALLVPIYSLPIWWVSLEAPNYPEEAFPDGVRILFHLNGVFNGCRVVENTEIQEGDALDCVHEMDTINHYVGMYPIAAGGPIEVSFSMFVVALLGVLLVGFLLEKPALRISFTGLGLVAIGVWMALTWYSEGGLQYHDSGYLAGRALVLGEDGDEDETDEGLTPGEAVIARLKASLEGSGVGAEAPAEKAPRTEKEAAIAQLRSAFLADQRGPEAERVSWKGNGQQLLSWHFRKTLGRYFNDPTRIEPMVAGMARSAGIALWGTLIGMAVLIVAARRTNGPFHWLMLLLPATLPVLFVMEYAAWLWWYGHNMSDMGAFTLKPFMPTVFGQGKVAQFTTSSYPEMGFWLMVAFSALLISAALLRRRDLRGGS